MYHESTELLRRFEDTSVPPGDFRHVDHIQVAWALLRRHETLEAIRCMDDGIRALAEKNNVPALYHRTVTWGYVLLIAERIARHGAHETFASFIEENADLLEPKWAALRRLYGDKTLSTDVARLAFVLPQGSKR